MHSFDLVISCNRSKKDLSKQYMFFSLLYHIKGTLLLKHFPQHMLDFISCCSFVQAKAELPGGCRKRGPCPPGKQFSVAARYTRAQRRPHRLHWHYYPCSQPLLGTGGARKTSAGAGEQLHIGLPGSCASSPQMKRARFQEQPNHPMGEPRQCRPTGSRPHLKTPPPACWRLTAGSWMEVR